MTRAELIRQKEAVQAEIRLERSALGRAEHSSLRDQHQDRLRSLMAQEHRLRLQIDQAPPDPTAGFPQHEHFPKQFLPLLRQSLAIEGSVRWQLHGDSMTPTLPRACQIEIVPLPLAVPLGSLVVFVSGDGLVAHRLVRREAGFWITQGDGRRGPDRPVAPAHVLGLVAAAYAGNVHCWPRPGSHLVAWLWIGRHHALRPARWIWRNLRRR